MFESSTVLDDALLGRSQCATQLLFGDGKLRASLAGRDEKPAGAFAICKDSTEITGDTDEIVYVGLVDCVSKDEASPGTKPRIHRLL